MRGGWLVLIAVVASVASLLSLGLVVAAGFASPLVNAADEPQYRGDRWQFAGCFANLSGPKPTCPYVIPTIPAGPSPNKRVMDAAAVAASGLNADTEDLLAAADALVSSQVDGTWPLQPEHTSGSVTNAGQLLASASTQGLAISVLARAYALVPRREYVVAIQEAVRAMPIAPSGWPLEVEGQDASLVGGMTALLGLWDAWRVAGDEAALAAFRRGASWLEANVNTFERGGVIFESRDPRAGPLSARRLVYAMRQLEVVGTVAHSDGLLQRAREWEWRLTNPGAFRLLLALQAAGPTSYLLAALAYFGCAELALLSFVTYARVSQRSMRAKRH